MCQPQKRNFGNLAFKLSPRWGNVGFGHVKGAFYV
ncbi:hypothetical protein SPLC1_S543090 [Arthrospira platensis C1]|nr:hypothetical protein SPLC1_S543090 [Arthrospira platensis C1]